MASTAASDGPRARREIRSPHRPTKRPTGIPSTPQQQQIGVRPVIAFAVFFATHLVAALYSPIQDCDEVFNFWEPTHYLNHGHGFQTWEYSPAYAIRSWTYIALHAVVTPLARLVPFVASAKLAEFYLLRIFLGFVCALCESRLFSKLASVLNPRIAVFYLLVTVASPGFYHASVAFLPSSFAMYMATLGTAAFMDWRGGLRTAQGIWCFGVGAVIGWPFVGALCIPFLLEELLMAVVSDAQAIKSLFFRVVDGVVRTLLVLGAQIGLDDMFFYKKFTIVPLNIVLYNVFGSNGPALYGTEPWHFYLRNLFLNFHVWLLLALLSLPLLLAQHMLRAKGATRASYLRGIFFLSPFYLWLAIFTLQPHKEERFMYPAYPLLAVNAAVALHIVLANVGSTDPKDLVARIPVRVRLAAVLGFVLFAVALSAFRVLGVVTAYRAPLAVYAPLHLPGVAKPGDSVCLGKEWYRFPSHYFLPLGVRAKFIQSEFRGLLPGEFSEAAHGFGLYPGTWLLPPGMNDANREDVAKYTDLRRCDFLVDSRLPSASPSPHEPDFFTPQEQERWETLACVPFLDAAASGAVGRMGWIPDLSFSSSVFSTHHRRVWGEYCLLRRRPDRKITPSPIPRNRKSAPNIETLL